MHVLSHAAVCSVIVCHCRGRGQPGPVRRTCVWAELRRSGCVRGGIADYDSLNPPWPIHSLFKWQMYLGTDTQTYKLFDRFCFQPLGHVCTNHDNFSHDMPSWKKMYIPDGWMSCHMRFKSGIVQLYQATAPCDDDCKWSHKPNWHYRSIKLSQGKAWYIGVM